MKTKNSLKCAMIALMVFTFSMNVSAQTKAERKALKNEVKDMKKDGWKVNPGYLTLEEQIVEGKKILKNQDQWVIGEAKTTGNVYDAVRSNALFEAKKNIVSNFLKMAGKMKGGDGVDQGSENSASATRYRDAAQAKFIGEIRRPRYLMDCFRELEGGKVEVNIRLAIPWNEAEKSYNDIMKELKEMLDNEQ